jgi:glycosyltransferase involved in cell wall biosynthesis
MYEKRIGEAKPWQTSVVIPTKNSIKTIDKCLASLMPYYKEGYINEIVVVDGHSTDGTRDVVKNYPAKLLSDEGKGAIGLADDIGWRAVSGEFILILDSDLYLGEGFFPRVYELFSDDKIGWIACEMQVVATNRHIKALGENRLWANKATSDYPRSWFWRAYSNLYHRVTNFSSAPWYGTGCIVVRRICLEAVNGFRDLRPLTLRCGNDTPIYWKAANKRWGIIWWRDAPVYHHLRDTFKELIRECYSGSKAWASLHLENEFRGRYPWYNKVISIIGRAASPLTAILPAVRNRNPMYIFVYTVHQYTFIAGYIVGWLRVKTQK